MKKKILTATLTTLAALALSTSAFALTEGDWEFQLLDDEVTITGYLGDDANITIPDTIFGATVTEVELSWDHNFRNAVSVKFPSTVKVINNCGWDEDLQYVYLPEGVERLNDSAFASCTNLTNINLPSTMKEMDIYAFSSSGLTSIDLSKSNIEFKYSIFSNCTNLVSAKFHPELKEIPWSFFHSCSNLQSVDIPSSVTTIDNQAFYRCTSLEQIILPSSLDSIGENAFAHTALKEVVIPYGTTSIGSSFDNNKNLKSLYIPDTVKYLSSSVLYESPNCIIYCSKDSYTAKRCKEQSISYLTDKSVNSGITVLYNGTRISFHTYDQNPELINNRTLVPLRSIFEAMDADVQWDDATKTAIATRNGVTIKIPIGANEIYKDGQAIAVDVPAQILNSRTMIPVRVIAEAFGADVQWNANGKTVLINE